MAHVYAHHYHPPHLHAGHTYKITSESNQPSNARMEYMTITANVKT